MKIKMGLIGAGTWGLDIHAVELREHEEFDLTAVCDPLAERRELASRLFHVPAYQSQAQMYASQQLEAVVVVVPPHVVCDTVLEALEAGKAVITEKPFAPTVAECDRMIQMAKEKDLMLTVHHNRRWDCGYRTLENAIAEGLLGQVFSLQAHCFTFGYYQGATDWRLKEGGGLLVDIGPHMVDWMLQLAGSPANEVFCVLQNRLWEKQSEDYFKIVMVFGEGLVAQADATQSARMNLPVWFVMGTKGTLITEDKGPIAVGAQIRTESDGEPTIVKPKVFPKYWQGFYDNFARAYRGQEPLAVLPSQAREVVRVLEAARTSAETGHSVTL